MPVRLQMIIGTDQHRAAASRADQHVARTCTHEPGHWDRDKGKFLRTFTVLLIELPAS